MSAADRRALVLDAATRAFARHGYAGTTTDAVAKEAAVSQPYVVRIFGSKEDLFVEVLERALQRICATFTEVVEQQGAVEDVMEPLGAAYTDLVLRDRDLLRVMMHGFMAASAPKVGAVARRGMAEVSAIVLTTGCGEERARDFVAHGMLINVLLSIQALEHADEEPGLDTLARSLMGEVVDTLSG